MAHSIKKNNLKIDLIPKFDPSFSGGGWPLYTDNQENWAWQKNIFSDSEIEAIINIGKSIPMNKGMTSGINSDDVRNSHVSFIFPNMTTSWIFAKLADSVNYINSKFFNFDIHAMEQGIQFTEYKAPGQHYEWHIDRAPNTSCRKLSVSVQLSDPDEYEGGDLELWFGGTPEKASREKGMATFFPSHAMHRVSPVTKGTRYSLVCWVSGPPFK